MSPINHPKMNQEFFTNLPSEIIISILSRLPVRTTICCKCVCKPWLGLIETHEFAKAHLSKSAPGLAVFHPQEESKLYRIFEFEDGLDLEHHDLHYNPLTKFNLPYHGWIHGSVNGLLFLRDQKLVPEGLFICNPITHEYIKLHCPQEFVCSDAKIVTYGFGASKITGQHKVARIFQDLCRETDQLVKFSEPECQVYTLGTGSWRRIATAGASPLLVYNCHSLGAFLNGNLHCMVTDLNCDPLIFCFDLETERFSAFSFPPHPRSKLFVPSLVVLGDCICLCDNESDDEIVIWLMKEYGVEKSWTKEFVISKAHEFMPFRFMFGVVYPIKVFVDGDILMVWDVSFLFYYSKKKETETFEFFEHNGCNATIHTPSFLSLKSFAMENVVSF